ncbi:hypothetical protein [Novosphingobium sp.]|uniref:hypothetical protein n=1 Tax=Novosphingobium sp. TaxID=1874826 RepID=UPI0038F65A36
MDRRFSYTAAACYNCGPRFPVVDPAVRTHRLCSHSCRQSCGVISGSSDVTAMLFLAGQRTSSTFLA